MKRLIIVLTFFILLLSCEKQDDKPTDDPNKGTVTFWTTEESGVGATFRGWLLWVDGIEIGVIQKPYPINTTDQIPVCGDKRFTKLSLMKGRHSYYMTLFIPVQPPPNYFVSQTYYFDIIAGGCTVVRCKQ